jgi:hypothetical protein
MEKNLTNTLAGIDRLVNNPDLKASIGELKGVFPMHAGWCKI